MILSRKLLIYFWKDQYCDYIEFSRPIKEFAFSSRVEGK